MTTDKTPGALVLVPAVATLEMKNAGWREADRQGVDPESIEMQTIWFAMCNAAPAEQTPAVGGETITRWHPQKTPIGTVVRPHSEGDFVTLADHCAHVAPLLAEIEQWRQGDIRLIDENERLHARIAELEAEIDQLRRAERNDAIAYRAAIEKQEELRGRIAELEAQQGEPVAYADPKAFDNFKSGIATHEWMWAFPDNGLQPLYRAQPATAKVDEWTEFTRAFPDADQRADGTFIHGEDANKWAAWQARAKLNP